MRKAQLLVAVIGLFSFPLFGQTVFLLPNSTQGTPNVSVYTASPFSGVGTFAADPTAFTALSRADGGEYYIITNSSSNTVITTTSSLGNVVSLIGFGSGANAAIRTPDGTRILVAAGGLEIINTVNDSVQPAISVGGTAIDLAASIDSTQAYVLVNTATGYQLVDVDLRQLVSVKTLSIPGTAAAVTAGPNGLIYVGTTNGLLEVDPTSLAVLNTYSTSGTPGKLSFTPNGRFGLAPNLNNSTGVALYVFDVTLKTVVSPPFTTTTVPNQLSQVYVVGDNLAYGVSKASGSLYTLQISSQTATVFQFAASGTVNLAAVTSDVATTSAIPAGTHTATQFLLFVSAGVLYEFNIANNAIVQQTTLNGGTPGAIAIATPANTSTFPSSLLPYGDQQVLAVNTTSAPIVVRAVDLNGKPVPGVGVNFSSSSGAVLSTPTSLTNDDGLAATRVTFNTTGQVQVTAAAGNVLNYTFTLNFGTSGSGGGGGGGTGGTTPSGLTIVNGQGTLVPAGTAVSADTTNGTMKVQYTDTSGNPIVGANITFTQASGNGVLASVVPVGSLSNQSQSSITVATDSNGIAQSDYQAAGVDPTSSTQFAQAIIVASAPNGSSATFYVTSFNPGQTPTILLIAPDPGTVFSGSSGSTVSQPLQANITSFSGAAIPNVSLRIANPPDPTKGPSAQCSGGFALSDSTGTASCNLVLSGLAGTAQVVPEMGYASDFLPFVISVTASTPGKASIVSGNNQSGKPGQALAPFVVQITNGSGTPLPQIPVSWKVVSGAITLSQVSSSTNASGNASAVGTLGNTAGQAQVQVTAGSGSSQVTATFTATIVIPVTVGSLTLVSGNNQTANENAAFQNPLVVQVNDTNGNPVAGQAVTFVLTSGTATIATPTATTGANGQATTTVTAGATPGTVVITASSNGFNATFNLTIIAPGPSNVVFLNGASFQPGASAGAIVTIQGTNITPGVTGVMIPDNILGPLPTQFAGISVTFNGTPAPIFSVSNVNGVQQITVQVPWEVAGLSTASVVINTPGGGTGTFTVNLTSYSPGVFTTNAFGLNNQVVAIRPDGSYVSPANPAHRGETIIVFVTGLGQTSPAQGTGDAGIPNQNVLATIAVGFNNAGAPFTSVQTVVGVVGVVAIAVQVPANTAAGPSQPFGMIVYDASGNAIFGNSTVIPIQ